MTGYAALLRAVNVGGRSAPSRVLAQVAADAGFTGVRTYRQSGNIVLAADADASRVERLLADALSAALAMPVTVLVRSAAELAGIVAANPFRSVGAAAAALHVTFLAAAPLGPAPDPPPATGADAFVVVAREVYLHTPAGYGRTKLTNAFFERRLRTAATTRNWNTVTALAELAAGAS